MNKHSITNLSIKDLTDFVMAGGLGCFLGCLLILLVAGVWFGFVYGVAYLVVLVGGGFGYILPFWPVFGVVVLVQLLCGALFRRD